MWLWDGCGASWFGWRLSLVGHRTPRFAPSRQSLPFWLSKCGLTAQKIVRNANLWYTFAPNGCIPLGDFYQILPGKGAPGPHCRAKFKRCIKLWPYGTKNRQRWQFLVKICTSGKILGSIGKLEHRCTTTNLPLCNYTTVTLLYIVSVITNFKRDKKKQKNKNKKTSHFFVYNRRATQDPHHTWHGDRGGPSHFCVP